MLVAMAMLSVSAVGAPRDMLPAGDWSVIRPAEGDMSAVTTAGSDLPGKVRQALRITIHRPSEPFYATQLMKDIPEAVKAGTRIRLSFLARSRTANPLRAVVEKAGPPYTPVVEMNLTLKDRWTRYTASGTAPTFPPNGVGVRFQVGHKEGEIELADIHLWDDGPDPLARAAEAAVTPEAVEAHIQKYRTGTLRVQVVDRSGNPVQGASVAVEQTRHAFLFGCNIFMLSPSDASNVQRQYQERFTALLHYATLPFYWGAFEPRQGEKDYARLDAMAQWCREHGLTTKGHPLVWHEVYPRWAPTDPEKAVPLLEARVKEIIGHYRGLIRCFDVVNEANVASAYGNTGTGAWIKQVGPATAVAAALRWAREAAKGSDTVLIYNDFDTSDANVQLLQGLKQRHMLPDAVGIQSHMHGGVWPLERVWSTAERFAAFGKPVHFTEVTVVSGPRPSAEGAPWATTPAGEAEQADYVERFYSVLFSHPAVEAITWWDFSDLGAWQNAPAGLVRSDMTPKPVYERLMRLIKGKWWTQASGRTDASGSYRTRAFQGEYKVTVTDPQGRTKTVAAELPIRKHNAVVRVVMD
jgi:GH35 family endo-1,4-beta-xylanase